MKKILAIHNNKMFFKKGAPNFYEWLCGERGLSGEYKELKEEYGGGKRGPRVLPETFCLSTGGLTLFELQRYCDDFRMDFLHQEMADKIVRLAGKMNVFIFTSYPKELYANFFQKTVAGVFGVEPELDEDGLKIENIASIRLYGKKDLYGNLVPIHLGFIKSKMDELGFFEEITPKFRGFGYNAALQYEIDKHHFTIEPDRYGMLVLLLDQMAVFAHRGEDVIVVGKGVTAELMHKVAGRVIESLEEL